MSTGPQDPWDAAHSVAAPLTSCVDDDAAHPISTERYEVRGSVGQGGMGQVDVVRDHWLDRDVAKKVLHAGGRDARLAREAAITARLEHPGIVPIFDTGLDHDGRRFYTMRLVRGQTLMDALNTASLPQRLQHVRALLAAANAVAHAHSVGIVHRDLKPSNVLLGRFGQVQVVDWGIAGDIGAEGRPEGTPSYSHPGQLAGNPVSTVHDVFALGRCLMHLLCGERPDGPMTPPTDAPAELVAVAQRAVSADPYPDAAAVAVDLEAYLNGRQVSAHDYSTRELLVRFVQTFRAPLVVGATGVTAIAVVIGLSVGRTQAERDRALAAEATANLALGESLTSQAVSHFEDGQYAEAERAAAKALSLGRFPRAVGVLAARHGTSVRWLSSIPPLCDDYHILFNGDVGCVYPDRVDIHAPTGELRRSIPERNAQGVRNMQDGHITITHRNDPDAFMSRVTYYPDSGEPISQVVEALRVAFGGTHIQAHHGSERATLWNVLTNTVSSWLPCPDEQHMPTGRPSWRDDGMLGWSCDAVLAWGVPSGTDQRILLDSPVGTTTWSGDVLVASTYDGQLRGFEDGSAVWSVPTPGGTASELTANDDWVIAQPERSGPQFFDPHSQLWHRGLPLEDAGQVRLFDGTLTTIGRRISTWSVTSPRRPHRLTMPGGVTAIAWSNNGKLAVSAGTLVVYVDERGNRHGHEQPDCRPVKDVAWNGEDEVIRQCAGTQTVLARLSTTGEASLMPNLGPGPRVVASDGWFVSTTYGLDVFRVHQENSQEVIEEFGLTDAIIDLEQRRGGERAFLLKQGGALSSLGRQGEPVAHWMRNDARAIAVSPEGDALVVSTRNSVAQVSLTNEERWLLTTPSRPTDLAWSDDGDLVAIGMLNGQTWVVDAKTGEQVAVLVGHNERVSSVAFSPDGTVLATGSWDRSIRLWDVDTFRAPASVQQISQRYGWHSSPTDG